MDVIKLRLCLYMKPYLLWKQIYHHISVPFYISNAVTFSANLTAYTIWRSAVALPHLLSLSLRRIALFVRRHLRCRYPSLCGDRIRSPPPPFHCLSVPQQLPLHLPSHLHEIWCRCFYVTSRNREFRDILLSDWRGKGRGPQVAEHHYTTRNGPEAIFSFVKIVTCNVVLDLRV